MWLYRHHTCDDIIDLDHRTGVWRPVEETEQPEGARVLADLPVRGAYTDEDGKRYFSYWTDDGIFVFRAPENRIFEVCRKHSDGAVVALLPGLWLEIEPSRHGDGRLKQGFSDVRLLDAEGKELYGLTYESEFYRRLYAMDMTAASMVQDLSDWDFFVALKGALEIFHERAESGRVELSLDEEGRATIEGRKIAKNDLLYADTGDICERSGVWSAINDLRGTVLMQKGDVMPKHNGVDIMWVWSRES